MQQWSRVNKTKLRREIGSLRAYGATCLSAAIDCATDMFASAGEGQTTPSLVVSMCVIHISLCLYRRE